MHVSSPVDFYPGSEYKYIPEISNEIGDIKSVVFSWEKSGLNLIDILKKQYLNLVGDIKTTDANGFVSVFTPATTQVQSGKNVAAKFVRSYYM